MTALRDIVQPSVTQLRSVPTAAAVKAELGLLPQPVAYALAAVAAIILVVIVLKLVRKVVGKIIGVVVSLAVSIGIKLFLADPSFHTWLLAAFHTAG